jgi:rhodanese-related sulfurtransferase
VRIADSDWRLQIQITDFGFQISNYVARPIWWMLQFVATAENKDTVSNHNQRRNNMRLRNTVLALATTGLIAAGAFGADLRQHDHDHGSAKAADKKEAGVPAKQQMTAKELKARLDKGEKVIIIDARHDLGGQILKGAIHVPSDKLEEWAKTADKNAVIVTYCTCPHDEAADAEMEKLLQMGFKNAYSLTGGMDAARSAGIEVVTPAEK